MSDVKKPDWPQTPDGTIDWETVFEDPTTGIIPVLSQAPNKKILHKISVTVVKQLFARKDDAVQVERFLKELDAFLGETDGSEDLPVMRDSILNLLRRIKDGRVTKAAAYVAGKKKEAADDARKNRKTEEKQNKRRAGEARKKKTMAIVLIGAAAVLLVVLIALMLFLFGGGDETPPDQQQDQFEETEQKKMAPVEQPAPPSEPVKSTSPRIELSEGGYPLGQMTIGTVAGMGLNVMILERFFWAGQVEGGRAQGTSLVPVLIIKDPDMASSICTYGPKLTDALNLALQRSVSGSGKAGPDDMRHAGQVAMRMVNISLGKAWVTDLYLLYDVDTNLLETAKKCQLVEP